MALDVIDLRQFYASPLGKIAHRAIADAVAERWESVSGMAVLGLGYAPPYLDAMQDNAERSIAFMPGRLGVLAWPEGTLSAVGLVDPLELPLRDAVIDRLLVVHALEISEDANAMLEELWRVLTPGGRMIVVAPNRRGGWAKRDSTPFGFDQPYSRSQITALLRQALFTPVNWQDALYFPPARSSLLLSIAPMLERLGTMLKLPFAGVHIVEATKQLYRPVIAGRKARASARLQPVLVPTTRQAE